MLSVSLFLAGLATALARLDSERALMDLVKVTIAAADIAC